MAVSANTDSTARLWNVATGKAQIRDIGNRQSHKQDPLIINFGQDNPVYLLQ